MTEGDMLQEDIVEERLWVVGRVCAAEADEGRLRAAVHMVLLVHGDAAEEVLLGRTKRICKHRCLVGRFKDQDR